MTLQELKKKLNEEHEFIFKELGMKIEVFNRNVYSTCPVHGGDNPRVLIPRLRVFGGVGRGIVTKITQTTYWAL